MSRRNGRKVELNPSPPRARQPRAESPTSPPSSCISSEPNLRHSTSPEATSMMLVGCPRCLMYVMLAGNDPRCPKCKSAVLLDFVHENNATTSRKTKNR